MEGFSFDNQVAPTVETGAQTESQESTGKLEIMEKRRSKTSAILAQILESPIVEKIGKIPGPNVLHGGLELILGEKSGGETLSTMDKIVRMTELSALAYVATELTLKQFGVESTYLDASAIGAKGVSWFTYLAPKILPKIQESGMKDFVVSNFNSLADKISESKVLIAAIATQLDKISEDRFDFGHFQTLGLLNNES